MLRTFFAPSLVVASWALWLAPAYAEKPMLLETRLGTPVMKGGETQRNFLRIALNGCEREKSARTPVNVAFVIDRSGSMNGFRIAQAREAAVAAIKRLNADDIAAVVIFDDKIDVLVDARKVDDPGLFVDRIQRVAARGQTAIYTGVTEGAREVRKFKDDRRLNRIVLLSDGQANVGPRRADDFAKLGAELLAEGISVSTIGLGLDYNEDLMLQLARASDGNHAFVGEASDLVQIFNREFDDVLASCAQMVSIDVELAAGVRPLRSLSRDGTISGQRVQFKLNQVYQATEHFVLLEVEVDPAIAGGDGRLGSVHVAYTAPQDGARQTLDARIEGRFSTSADEVRASRDGKVFEAVLEQSTRERAREAVRLRDQGRVAEAMALFQQNVSEISTYTAGGPASDRLRALLREYEGIAKAPAAAVASPTGWATQRKVLRALEFAPAGALVRP